MKRMAAACVLAAMMAVTAFAFLPTADASGPGSDAVDYGDVSLSGGYQAGHFPDLWDLTASDLTIEFTYDATGLVDEFGGEAHAWSALGVRELGYGDFNPTWQVEGAGVWLATDYDWSVNTFGPDPEGAPISDLDDKLILQKAGNVGEGDYNLPEVPSNPWANYGVWFDRDGVDPWQAEMWGSVSGGTYNTGGIYEVVLTLHATGPTAGTAYMTVNGVSQGFYVPDWHNSQPDLYPAGMTFTGNMGLMQVYYGLYGYGAVHGVSFNDILVSGTRPMGSCQVDIDLPNKVLTLLADCTTDHTILVPDGWTLDGTGPDWVRHTITAVDPVGGHFLGAVVKNAGPTANVRNLTVTALGLSGPCDEGAPRLRGIMFEGASGSIFNTTVTGINQGPSGCQEGNAIEIRNEPFDGTHPATTHVEISYSTILDYQKTGIVANGDVDVDIHHNTIGASATQYNLAANSVQYGFGGMGSLTHNLIFGNQWFGTSDYAATAVLLYDSGVVDVSYNNIRGNSDIGIYLYANGCTVDNNRVYDEGPDGNYYGYDVGIGNYGQDNTVTRNKVRGFDIPYEGPYGGKNKIVPGPNVGGSL